MGGLVRLDRRHRTGEGVAMSLFPPYDLAGLALPNRIVMAPLTRSRTPDDIADAMTATYYGQRASAGLIISEGTPISREGQGYLFNPGIFSPQQIAGWRKTTAAVHAGHDSHAPDNCSAIASAAIRSPLKTLPGRSGQMH
jgi:hypothetical protein